MVHVKKGELTELPKSLRSELLCKLEAALKEDKNKAKSNDEKYSAETIAKVRQAFFTAVVKLFMTYKPFIKVVGDQTIFDAKEFIKNSDEGYKAFYKDILD